MSITVRELFHSVGIDKFYCLKWGEKFCEVKQGVYVVSISNNPDAKISKNHAQFDDIQIKFWIDKLPKFKVDEYQASLENVKKRLNLFWLENETIVYIGKAPTRKSGSGIGQRITEYYSTVIGDGGPHSGGQWVKVLAHLHKCSIYYGYCDNPSTTENNMLAFFKHQVRNQSQISYLDSVMPIPFANIKFKGNKKHGLSDQRI